MDFFDFVQKSIRNLLTFFNSLSFVILLALFVIFFHIIFYLFRDRKYVKALKKFKDPETVTLKDLKDIPLVNIIIPAWKEGRLFEDCLISITKLNYPKLKIIVNAGGNEETIKMANLFINYKNFLILEQKPGGKIKAINDCLKYTTEGIICTIDADILINDEAFYRLIYPITNYEQNVVAGKEEPFEFLRNKNLVKYLKITRNLFFRRKFARYNKRQISGSNTCFKYEVIKAIGKFTEGGIYGASDRMRGYDIISKGYQIYQLIDSRCSVSTYYPSHIKSYIHQNKRWIENGLTSNEYKKKRLKKIAFFLNTLLSLYIFIMPILLFINFYLFLISLLFLLFKYLKIIREYIFYKATTDKRFLMKFNYTFFIIIIFYIYIEFITNINVIFDLIFHRKELR